VDVLKILLKPSVFVLFVAACSAPAHDGQAGMYVPCSIFFLLIMVLSRSEYNGCKKLIANYLYLVR
jgi:hypothetical protein